MKSLCCVIHSPPHYHQRGENALDFILAASHITSTIGVIFLQQGILQLVPHHPEVFRTKNYAAGFGALPQYDITHIYADQIALQQYQLSPELLIYPATLITHKEIQTFIHQYDCVVYF